MTKISFWVELYQCSLVKINPGLIDWMFRDYHEINMTGENTKAQHTETWFQAGGGETTETISADAVATPCLEAGRPVSWQKGTEVYAGSKYYHFSNKQDWSHCVNKDCNRHSQNITNLELQSTLQKIRDLEPIYIPNYVLYYLIILQYFLDSQWRWRWVAALPAWMRPNANACFTQIILKHWGLHIYCKTENSVLWLITKWSKKLVFWMSLPKEGRRQEVPLFQLLHIILEQMKTSASLVIGQDHHMETRVYRNQGMKWLCRCRDKNVLLSSPQKTTDRLNAYHCVLGSLGQVNKSWWGEAHRKITLMRSAYS